MGDAVCLSEPLYFIWAAELPRDVLILHDHLQLLIIK